MPFVFTFHDPAPGPVYWNVRTSLTPWTMVGFYWGPRLEQYGLLDPPPTPDGHVQGLQSEPLGVR